MTTLTLDPSATALEWPCRLWLGATDKKGYGLRWHNGRSRRAHRVAFEEAFGPIPPGLWVLHHCDVPGCIEPSHLYAGTAQDNARDRDTRRRRKPPCGAANGRAVIAPEDVPVIRQLRRDGATLASIASRYQIGLSQAGRIARGQSWV